VKKVVMPAIASREIFLNFGERLREFIIKKTKEYLD
jgi:hypothetical protein